MGCTSRWSQSSSYITLVIELYILFQCSHFVSHHFISIVYLFFNCICILFIAFFCQMDLYDSHSDNELDWKFIECELSVIRAQDPCIKKLIGNCVEEEGNSSSLI